MNDDLQTYIEPEMEARIVALVLGEASAFEAGELARLIAGKAELQTYQKRIEEIHGLVGEAYEEGDDSKWKLLDKRRGKVFSKIEERKREDRARIEKLREKQRSRQRLVYACAACLVVTMIMLVMMTEKALQEKVSYMSDSSVATEAMVDRKFQASSEARSYGLDESLAKGRSASMKDREEGPIAQSAAIPDAFFDRRREAMLELQMSSALANLGDAIPTLEESNQILRRSGATGPGARGYRTESSAIAGKADAPSSLNELVDADPASFEVPTGAKVGSLPLVGRFFREGQKENESREESSPMQRSRRVAVNGVAKKPAAPSSSQSKVIVANTTSPAATPVPVPEIPNLEMEFGDGDNFGDGWAGKKESAKKSASRGSQRPGAMALGVDKASDGGEPEGPGSSEAAATLASAEHLKSAVTTNGRLVAKKASLYDLKGEKNAETTIPLTSTAGANIEIDDSREVESKSEGLASLRRPSKPKSALVIPEMEPETELLREGVELQAEVDGKITSFRSRVDGERSRDSKTRSAGDFDGMLPAEEFQKSNGNGGIVAGGSGNHWDFDDTAGSKEGKPRRDAGRLTENKAANSPELFGLTSDIVTDSTDLPLTQSAGINSGFDDSLARKFGRSDSRGGEAVDRVTSRNNRDFIGNADRKKIPGIPPSEGPIEAELEELDIAVRGVVGKDFAKMKKRVVLDQGGSPTDRAAKEAYSYWADSGVKANAGKPESDVKVEICLLYTSPSPRDRG